MGDNLVAFRVADGLQSSLLQLVELLNLTFESELAADGTQMSNSLH
jgi:hypothetical protein